MQTIEMFEVITQSQPNDYQSLEILKEAYLKLGRQQDVLNTSKRIAQAYVHLGQLSSAILEYETILQQFPDDADALAAMADIESKANSLTKGSSPNGDTDTVSKPDKKSGVGKSAAEVDDGRAAMHKLFVDGKLISAGDFDLCWQAPPLSEAPSKIYEPFIQLLADKSILPFEKSLKVIVDKTRLGFLPLEKYDIDMDVARNFSKETCYRWCVLPFDRMSKSIFVATCNPFNKQAAEELQASTPSRLLWYLTSPSDLMKLVKKICR